MIGLLCLLLVTRHTRAEEEAGRLELLGAGAVGRGTALSAALTTAAVSCATVGAVATVVLLTLGEAASGSLALGLAYAATGLLFAGVAALAAQVARTGRAANGLGGALLGLAFLLRTVGDAAGPHGAGHWLVWLSPIGWAEQVQPFAADRWWVLLLQLVVAAAEMTGAYALLLRRDHGAGLLPDRPGPADAPSSLRGAAGLAWRLQRAGLWGWTAALLVSGLVLGAITDGVRQLVDDSAQVAQMMERMGGTTGVVDSYLSTCMTFLAMASAAYAVQSTLRLRGEETGGGPNRCSPGRSADCPGRPVFSPIRSPARPRCCSRADSGRAWARVRSSATPAPGPAGSWARLWSKCPPSGCSRDSARRCSDCCRGGRQPPGACWVWPC
ncbi:hypothetical protein ACFQZC_36895 [Streptacidiphilus monticola]